MSDWPVEPSLYCRNCKAAMPSGEKFCRACGRDQATGTVVREPMVAPRPPRAAPEAAIWGIAAAVIGIGVLVLGGAAAIRRAPENAPRAAHPFDLHPYGPDNGRGSYPSFGIEDQPSGTPDGSGSSPVFVSPSVPLPVTEVPSQPELRVAPVVNDRPMLTENPPHEFGPLPRQRPAAPTPVLTPEGGSAGR